MNNMTMTDAFTPSALLGQTHLPYRKLKGTFPDAMARIADQGFYRAAEIADVADAADRRRIREIVHASGLILTQWISPVIYDEALNQSALDESIRRKSVGRIREFVEPAAECGVSNFGVLGGLDPGPALREAATGRLYDSLCELCEAIRDHAPMRLVLEPLDRGAHKNGLIGPTAEAVALIRRVRRSYPDAALCWDSAHAALCGEDVLESISASHPYVCQVHLANAVLDRAREGFGDYHMPVGPPGFLDVETIAALFGRAAEIGLFFGRGPMVAIEVGTLDGGDPWETEARGREVLEQAWSLFQERNDRA